MRADAPAVHYSVIKEQWRTGGTLKILLSITGRALEHQTSSKMEKSKNLLKGSVFIQVGVRKLLSDVRMEYTRDFTLGRTIGCIVRSILEMVVFTISHLF